MNKLFAAAAVVATLGVALPAAAQSWGGDRYNQNDARRIEQRIERGVRDGSLTEREARNLSRRLDEIRRLEWRFGRDGVIDRREARDLDNRYAALSAQIRSERRDRDYGYSDNIRGFRR